MQVGVELLVAERLLGSTMSDENCTWVHDELGADTFLKDLIVATLDEVGAFFHDV